MYLLPVTPAAIFTKGSILITAVFYISKGLFSSLQSVQSNPPLTPVIFIENGPIQGKISMSRNGQKFWEFLSLPYAEPPLGPLRFQPPVPWKEPWKEVRKSIKMPPACVQFEGIIALRTIGVEDCLFLNVFTQPVSEDVSQDKKAVIVYFHPGAFLEGEATFHHPTYLMDHPVVVVVCQFRLGPMGFLNFQEKGSNKNYPRGNMALKDQNLVLKWVQRNIGQFGGDPKRVTLLGDASGTVSINFHMISPLSQGLFHKAIGTSGSILSPWAYTGNARAIAEKYAVRMGCNPKDIMNSSDGLLECYQKKEASEIVKYQQSWGSPLVEKDTFVPSIEMVEVTEDTFLSESPRDIVKRYGQEGSTIAKIPVMFGVMSGEGTPRSAKFEAYPELLPKLDRDWDNQIGRFIIWDEDPMKAEMAKKIRSYYFDGVDWNGDLVEVIKRLTWLSGDAMFVEPVQTMAMLHAKQTGAPTYLFFYNYSSNYIPGSYSLLRAARLDDGWLSVARLLRGILGDWFEEKVFGWGSRGGSKVAMTRKEVYGVGHGESTSMVWNPFRLLGGLVEGDRKFSEDFVRAIVEFAMEKNERIQPSFRGLRWPSLNGSNLDEIPYMVMDNGEVPKVITKPFSGRIKFWENLLSRY